MRAHSVLTDVADLFQELWNIRRTPDDQSANTPSAFGEPIEVGSGVN
jgi:hypothetical protein